MASVTIKFYSLWRQYLGIDSITIDADNLEQALAQVEEKFGQKLREQLMANGIQVDGRIHEYSLVLLNGASLRNLKQTNLKDGDQLQIFPPATGG